jgi:hypothetical protein
MPSSSAAAPAGHGSGELFFLSDEQILEIAPDGSTDTPGSAPEAAPRPAEDTAARTVPAAKATPQSAGIRSIGNTPPSASAAPPGTAVLSEPPPVLAQMMADPESGAEARELWSGIQEARAEVAAYRACFASPEEARALKELYPGGAAEARAAAERARVLDEIDAAYFGGAGSSPEQASAARAALAERLLRENPAAFREMVFAGLRALENAAAVSEAAPASPAAAPRPQGVTAEPPFGAAASGPVHASPAASHPALSAYAAFEQAANADLERSVGDSIERTLARALPNLARDEANAGARPGSVSLRDRLAASIRQEIEQALRSDRQLSEQVTQILSARRFDAETRAHVVRLIGDRARQLVPGAARRVIGEWTQSALAAHRAPAERSGAGLAGREVPAGSGNSSALPHASPRETALNIRADRGPRDAMPRSRNLDYRKLSDEQILDL